MLERLNDAKSWTKTQLSVFFIITLLAVDEINPVKLFLHTFPSITPQYIAMGSTIVMMYIFVSDLKEMVYFASRIFLHSMLSIFFSKVEIIGRDNIPRHGPVLFTVNHANQFMDAVPVVCTSQHKISYLMAEASWKRPIVGHIAWALDVVPVKRAQDEAKKGTGTITYTIPEKKTTIDNDKPESAEKADTEEQEALVEMQIHGTGTLFASQFAAGDKLRPPGTAMGLKVTQIHSDTLLSVDVTDLPDDYPTPPAQGGFSFDILKRTPLSVVFGKVLERLASGGAIGIFPEGGSHDRTDLLPLKVGVALIAYMALEQNGQTVPIVPVGLNYFRTHRWRGRCVVEYGRPIYVDQATLPDFAAGGAKRRAVCNGFLEEIQSAMRSVLVSTTDYDTLQLVHAARRLYQRPSTSRRMDTQQKQDLNRRFAEGYRQLLLMTNGDPPQEWLQLQERIVKYRRELRDLGLKDYQVPGLTEERLETKGSSLTDVDGDTMLWYLKIPYHIVHLLLVIVLAAIPVLLLNVPVGLMADLYSERRRKKALARSKVKIHGYDVMLTEKVIFCLVMVPTLWILYGVALVVATDWDGPTISLAILCMPLFAYLGIIVSEAGMVDWQDLRPFFMRLFPSTRKRLSALPETRKQLQQDLRRFIKDIGPGLGDIYYGKTVDWKAILEKSHQQQDKKTT